jgi:hypothetical protein
VSEPRQQDAETPPKTSEAATDSSFVGAVPGLVRIGLAAWWRTTGWSVETTARAGSRVLRAAVSGESPAELFQGVGSDVRTYLRRLLEIMEPEEGEEGAPEGTADAAKRPPGSDASTAELRERGADLLRRSADVHLTEDPHPAYARILDNLAPDEGRILRLLALEGPRASVDVRTARPLNVGSELVAPGLTMIGAEAGCRQPERVRAYLNNLYRLGLVWFSREPVSDPLRYQVLEAQPEVQRAMEEAGRSRTVRRSIHLTPFGGDFCDTCLPLHTAELDLLPGDGEPSDGERGTEAPGAGESAEAGAEEEG